MEQQQSKTEVDILKAVLIQGEQINSNKEMNLQVESEKKKTRLRLFKSRCRKLRVANMTPAQQVMTEHNYALPPLDPDIQPEYCGYEEEAEKTVNGKPDEKEIMIKMSPPADF